ncbi:hypothetical protein EDB81DRAFT_879094 [Dactylonectria macrodidyma]|uniref:Uncharacterized protein n=1 Tax=Dactylonectria macrodidyma TaxID=307937 RepID=A0A9P9JJ22_9HYPO|nr:hypothetical protein EDB81DRAFT_879094 [Dactylonectria macrodidyma]
MGKDSQSPINPISITPIEDLLLKTVQSEPELSRREVPHLRAVRDPTGQFVVVPDLDANIVRIYAVPGHDLNLSKREHLLVAPGSGPINLAFAKQREKIFMYVFMGRSNTIDGYEVAYDGNEIIFDEVWASGHGKEGGTRTEDAAFEMVVYRNSTRHRTSQKQTTNASMNPDSKFFIILSRSESALGIPSFDPNSTTVASDRLYNFAIDPQIGSLGFL